MLFRGLLGMFVKIVTFEQCDIFLFSFQCYEPDVKQLLY